MIVTISTKESVETEIDCGEKYSNNPINNNKLCEYCNKVVYVTKISGARANNCFPCIALNCEMNWKESVFRA